MQSWGQNPQNETCKRPTLCLHHCTRTALSSPQAPPPGSSYTHFPRLPSKQKNNHPFQKAGMLGEVGVACPEIKIQISFRSWRDFSGLGITMRAAHPQVPRTANLTKRPHECPHHRGPCGQGRVKGDVWNVTGNEFCHSTAA